MSHELSDLLVECCWGLRWRLCWGGDSMYEFQGRAAFNVVDMNSGSSISQEISEFQRTLLVLCAFANLFVLILAIVCERPPLPPSFGYGAYSTGREPFTPAANVLRALHFWDV